MYSIFNLGLPDPRASFDQATPKDLNWRLGQIQWVDMMNNEPEKIEKIVSLILGKAE